jgi:hypothetical protein
MRTDEGRRRSRRTPISKGYLLPREGFAAKLVLMTGSYWSSYGSGRL